MFAFSSTPKTLKAAHATPLRGVQAAPHPQDISENTATKYHQLKGPSVLTSVFPEKGKRYSSYGRK
jgi:hypothetical protein